MTPSLAFCAATISLKKITTTFQNLVNSGLTTEQAIAKLRWDRILLTGAENVSHL